LREWIDSVVWFLAAAHSSQPNPDYQLQLSLSCVDSLIHRCTLFIIMGKNAKKKAKRMNAEGTNTRTQTR